MTVAKHQFLEEFDHCYPADAVQLRRLPTTSGPAGTNAMREIIRRNLLIIDQSIVSMILTTPDLMH